jgi:ATP-dependent DNA ligase
LNSKDLRQLPLTKRKDRLEALLSRFDCPAVHTSEVFDDGSKLLDAAEQLKLESRSARQRPTVPASDAGIG